MITVEQKLPLGKGIMIPPANNLNYYRLHQADINNKVSYSIIRTVNFGDTADELPVYPHPAKEKYLCISSTQQKPLFLTIYASLGKLVCTANNSSSSQTDIISIPVGNFHEGNYRIHVMDATGTKVIKPFVKLR